MFLCLPEIKKGSRYYLISNHAENLNIGARKGPDNFLRKSRWKVVKAAAQYS